MFCEALFHKLLILRTPGIGPVKYAQLLERFGSVALAVESLRADQALVDSVRREMDLAQQLGIIYICDDQPEYPKLLKNIKNHPPVISVRGNTNALRKPAVGIVGTRHATAAGMRFVHELACGFASHGYTVVSGMAMGTDTAAHNGALAAHGNENTIAVLAAGVDYIWPLENERLYHYILERGAVVSEMPVGSKPIANNFIQRNRWVAGISEKLILGEADLKSGSMATAEFAHDYGRPVFAIPGHPSDARSSGPNRLIKQGKAILCGGIFDFFDDEMQKPKPKAQESKTENHVLDKIGNIPVSESVLTELVKKDIAEIKRELVVLELAGKIKKLDAGYVKI
ncbi:MAG: DNA-processing protein DprA [Alphaproteobacteria bacterium]|nr:DNA-processing protein DprA [Alphaproteobacteria bacterium]